MQGGLQPPSWSKDSPTAKSVDDEKTFDLHALHIWPKLVRLIGDKVSLSDKPMEERMGSLVLAEMSIAQSFEFNSQELKFDGFVDFGDLVTFEDNWLADHALILMFRP